MPQIWVNVYANLREYTNGAPSVLLDFEPGDTVRDLLRRLDIPLEKARIVFLNNRAAGIDQVLSGDERVDLFSAIGGG